MSDDQKEAYLATAKQKLDAYVSKSTRHNRKLNAAYFYARTLFNMALYVESRMHFESLCTDIQLAASNNADDEKFLLEFSEHDVNMYAAKSVFKMNEYKEASSRFDTIKAAYQAKLTQSGGLTTLSQKEAEDLAEINYYLTTCQLEVASVNSDYSGILALLAGIGQSSPFYSKSLVNKAICHFRLKQMKTARELLIEADMDNNLKYEPVIYVTLKKYLLSACFWHAVDLYMSKDERQKSSDYFRETVKISETIIRETSTTTLLSSLRENAFELKYLSLYLIQQYDEIIKDKTGGFSSNALQFTLGLAYFYKVSFAEALKEFFFKEIV